MPKHESISSSSSSFNKNKRSTQDIRYTGSDSRRTKTRRSSEGRHKRRSREHVGERSRHVDSGTIERRGSLPERRVRSHESLKRHQRRFSAPDARVRHTRNPRSRKRRANTGPRRNLSKVILCVLMGLVIGSLVGGSIGYAIYAVTTSSSDTGDANNRNGELSKANEPNDVFLRPGDSPAGANDRSGFPVSINSHRCGKLDESVPNPFVVSPRHNSRRGRIVGGNDARIDQHPWQVSLWTSDHTCGGSIIATNWILFAAHCVPPFPHPDNWTVFAGKEDRREMRHQAQAARATHLIAHKDFDPDTYNNDVALLRLNKHLILNKDVKTVCLPNVNDSVKTGATCQISGWGSKSEGSSLPFPLQTTNVKIIDRNLCNGDDWLVGMVNNKMFCAGTVDGSRDACQGDSGSPLTCYNKNDGRSYQMGLVSWGIGCGEERMPGVYTNLPLFLNWIRDNIRRIENEVAGKR